MRLRNQSARAIGLFVALAVCAAGGGVAAQETGKPAATKHLVSMYDPAGTTWLRGNTHTHTTRSDGKASPQEVVDLYAKLGYDFLMISDHDQVTPVDGLDAKGMTLIPGNEITAKGPHVQHVGARTVVPPDADRQKVIDQIQKEGGFAVMNHPNWGKNYNHCDLELLNKLQGYVGIEIFNGVVLYLEGSELATDKWDRLLAKGRRVFGFATDDAHEYPDHAGTAWLMVQAGSRTADDILAAIRQGRFYASTGVTVDAIKVDAGSVTVRASNAQRFRVCADNGQVLKMLDGPEMRFEVAPDAKYTYIRIECYGTGDQVAWLQPMFLE